MDRNRKLTKEKNSMDYKYVKTIKLQQQVEVFFYKI